MFPAQQQSSAPTVPRIVNVVVKALLRSPLHGLIKNRMLLTFSGRKSGKVYTTPVSYFREGESIVCFTDSSWWKNLRGGAPVRIRLTGRDVAGMAYPIDTDTEAIAKGLERMLQKIPSDARYYQVTVGPRGQLSASDLLRAARSNVMIRIHLVNEGEQGPVV
jgi:deazaflavin-dependent oxidoreductase (nitroreductase family)